MNNCNKLLNTIGLFWLVLVVLMSISVDKTEAGIRKYQTKNNSYMSSKQQSRLLILTPVVSSLNSSSSLTPSSSLSLSARPAVNRTFEQINNRSSESFIRYRKNFVKLVENFLLKHIEKALKKKAKQSEEEIYDSSQLNSIEKDGIGNYNDDAEIDSDYYSAIIQDEVGPTWSRIMFKCNQTNGSGGSGCNNNNSGGSAINENLAKLSNRFRNRLNNSAKKKNSSTTTSSEEWNEDITSKIFILKNLLKRSKNCYLFILFRDRKLKECIYLPINLTYFSFIMLMVKGTVVNRKRGFRKSFAKNAFEKKMNFRKF